MKSDNYKYKIVTENKVPLFMVALMLAIFIGLAVAEKNMLFIALPFIVLLTSIFLYMLYRLLFVKIYIGEYGFYHSTSPAKKMNFDYAEIKKAWESTKGNKDCVTYITQNGEQHSFTYRPNQYNFDAVAFMLTKINGEDYSEKETEE